MNLRTIALLTSMLASGLLIGCGSPGEPLPPSLELARPVSDLRAVRKGNTVTLSWTAPTSTTDRHNIRHPGPTKVCRASGTLEQCGEPIANLASTKAHDKDVSRTFTDTLSSFSPHPDAKFVYAIEVLNSYGKTAGFSNQVEVPAAPTLPAPPDLKAELRSDGVHLSWSPATDVPESSGVRFIYRLYRRETSTNNQVVAGEVPVQPDVAPSLADSSIEWEKTYDYRIGVATLLAQENGGTRQVEGDEGPTVTIVAHDVFPPATPSGLQAVFSGPGQEPFIDLVWGPVTDADLAGYNVYRANTGGEATKLNPVPVKSPAFRDNQVLPGHEYRYSVSAVDLRGNESPRSVQAEQNVPEQ